MATSTPSGEKSTEDSKTPAPETELLNVSVEREGQKVSTKWGLHPKLKEELQPEEWTELTEIMGEVTTLIGNRVSAVLAENEHDQSGHA